MMKILVVAATAFEVQPLLGWLMDKAQPSGNGAFTIGNIQVEVLVTGIGVTATAWHLGRHQLENIHLAINAGIAGALDRSLEIGQTVHVVSERFGDLGIELPDGTFSDIFQTGLADPMQPPFLQGRMLNPGAEKAQFLPAVHGVTVQKVHGFEPSIQQFKELYPDAQVETMEGAAFFYGCLMQNIPFFEIRAISNYVEKRDRTKWNINGAVNALNLILLEMVGTLAE
jgi:futalosine hydrolase